MDDDPDKSKAANALGRLAPFTQGVIIAVLSAVGCLESIYSTAVMRYYFGFLSYFKTRFFFFLGMLVYSLPSVSWLSSNFSDEGGPTEGMNGLQIVATIGMCLTFCQVGGHILYVPYYIITSAIIKEESE